MNSDLDVIACVFLLNSELNIYLQIKNFPQNSLGWIFDY